MKFITIYAIIMLYALGVLVSWAIIADGNKYNCNISIIWPIILLILFIKSLIIAFKEIPKIWKM